MWGTPSITNDILDIGIRRADQRRNNHHYLDEPTSLVPADICYAEPTVFDIPCVPNPANYCRTHFASVSGTKDAGQQLKFAKGTTTLAFKFDGGIIVSVDSRSTTGNIIASQTVDKVLPINKHMLGTMAGGAADCSFWIRNLGIQCRMYELRHKKRISVAHASKLLANTLRAYRGYGLSMGTMITGWDETGPQLYYVDNSGTRLNGHLFSCGSGSTYAYGILDNYYRKDLTLEEAVDLGKRAIYHAAHRDAMSGGYNNLFHVTKDGWTKIHSIDVNDMYYEFQEEKG